MGNEAIMQMTKRMLAVVACCLICGCQTTNPAQQDSAPPSNPATFVHAYTKFSFPESVGSFHRVNIQKNDREGKDVGVGYNSSTPIAATIFVYPGSRDFALYPSPKLENASESCLTIILKHANKTCSMLTRMQN